MKVGDLIQFKGLRNSPLLGVVVGFDKITTQLLEVARGEQPHRIGETKWRY